MNNRELEWALHAWGEQKRAAAPAVHPAAAHLPVAYRSPDRLAARPSASRGTRWGVAPAVAAVLAVGVTVAVAVHGSRHRSSTPTSPTSSASAPTASTRYDQLILHDGDTVTASGEVVVPTGGLPRMCAPRVVITRSTVGPARLDTCTAGVALAGFDTAKLRVINRYADGVEGTASVEGVYRRGTIAVTSQGVATNSDLDAMFHAYVPCAAPSGGWPLGRDDSGVDPRGVTNYEQAHPGLVFEDALLWPSHRQAVMYVLTAGDPRPVQAALRPVYGKRLCVVRSAYSRAQIAAARAPFDRLQMADQDDLFPGFMSVGEGLGPDAQADVTVYVDEVTPALASLATAQPPGLVQFDAWLRPVGH